MRFDRQESMLKLNESAAPVLSICRSPVGLPKLPAPGGQTHFDILRQWLAHCDEKHKDCLPPRDGPLPTRLIDLGTKETPCIRLFETKHGAKLQYIALSHPRGQGPHFCTLRSNIEEHKRPSPRRSSPRCSEML
ncbi:hypothetical protein B0T19DRAFT_23133 [Cercophora scortea]|uniref:Uncharacterized protein n=1 Tax=Cercophora scortea TaxID=314031 RepID=A0AAE0J3L7_9PEZI|nr:hypothetical protein B0T19DRAFT_23133 [Cercophora scortea]